MRTREEIIDGLKKAYRKYRRAELTLTKPHLTKQFKNKRCKSALKVKQMRENATEIRDAWQQEVLWLYHLLPEVRQAVELQAVETAIQFAAELVRPQRRPKRMKNQLAFLEPVAPSRKAQPEEARIAGSSR